MLELEQPGSGSGGLMCLEGLSRVTFSGVRSLPTMDSETKLGPPGLYSKCFCSLSHLAGLK